MSGLPFHTYKVMPGQVPVIGQEGFFGLLIGRFMADRTAMTAAWISESGLLIGVMQCKVVSWNGSEIDSAAAEQS